MSDTALKPIFQGIANAIRYQEGSTGKIYPNTYEQRIRAIRSVKTEGICNVNLTASPQGGGGNNWWWNVFPRNVHQRFRICV